MITTINQLRREINKEKFDLVEVPVYFRVRKGDNVTGLYPIESVSVDQNGHVVLDAPAQQQPKQPDTAIIGGRESHLSPGGKEDKEGEDL